jgi:hypothetical protein
MENETVKINLPNNKFTCLVDGHNGKYTWQVLTERYPGIFDCQDDIEALNAVHFCDEGFAETANKYDGTIAIAIDGSEVHIWQGESGDIFAGTESDHMQEG